MLSFTPSLTNGSSTTVWLQNEELSEQCTAENLALTMAERPARTKDSKVAGVTADHAANSERHHRHTLLEVSWLLWTRNQLVRERE